MLVPTNLYTEHDLNDQLGLAGIERLRKATETGEIPSTKDGNVTWYKGADLIAWLTKPAATPKVEAPAAEPAPVTVKVATPGGLPVAGK